MFEPCPDGPARQIHNRFVDLIIGCPMMAVFRKIDRAAVFLTGFVTHHGDFTASLAASCNKGMSKIPVIFMLRCCASRK